MDLSTWSVGWPATLARRIDVCDLQLHRVCFWDPLQHVHPCVSRFGIVERFCHLGSDPEDGDDYWKEVLILTDVGYELLKIENHDWELILKEMPEELASQPQ